MIVLSPEFALRTTARFGATTVRPEVVMTTDLFRGTLGRLPDSAGFLFWLGEIRKAQCLGTSQVSAAVASLADLFFTSTEYLQR